jgi:Dolichyl-phosphate-mannose-protein mannosyltransferase
MLPELEAPDGQFVPARASRGLMNPDTVQLIARLPRFRVASSSTQDGVWRARHSDPVRVPARYPSYALVAVMIVFVALASLVAVKTPAWEGMDEPSHVQNIETLAGGHWYRIPHDDRLATIQARKSGGFLGIELHQPPLYYLLLAGFQRLAGQPARVVKLPPSSFPFLTGGFYAHHPSAQNRFLRLLRLPNVLLGLLTVLLTFLTARLVSTDPWTPVVAAAFVAFLPRFVFLSAFVTNDNLVNVLGAALAYSAARFFVSPTRWWAAAVGAVVGLLAITKLSALPVAAVLIPLAAASKGWLRRVEVIAVAAAAAVIVCGWYLIQNDVRYGDPLAIAASKHYLAPIAGLGTFGSPYVVTDPLRLVFSDVPVRIWQGFWYGSWGKAPWPWPALVLLWSGLAFALLGLRTKITAREAMERPVRNAMIALTALAVAGLISVWLVAFTTASYEARLAYVGLPSLACLAALGLERWKPPIRFLVPLLGLCGTVVAIQQNVLGVPWNH